MRKRMILQSLDSTRFETRDDQIIEKNLQRAKTEVVLSLLYGYEIALPQAYLLGSIAPILFLNEIIKGNRLEDIPFFPFVPAFPTLHVPFAPQNLDEYASFYWEKEGGWASSLFLLVDGDEKTKREVAKSLLSNFNDDFENFSVALKWKDGFQESMSNYRRYMYKAQRNGKFIFEDSDLNNKKKRETSHLDNMRLLNKDWERVPGYSGSEDHLNMLSGIKEFEGIINGSEKLKFSRALFFKHGEEFAGTNNWNSLRISIENNYTNNASANYLINKYLKSYESDFDGRTTDYSIVAFRDRGRAANLAEIEVFSEVVGDFEMTLLWDLYKEKEFLGSINALHYVLINSNDRIEKDKAFSRHTEILSKLVKDLNFDLDNGKYIATPQKALAIASKSVSEGFGRVISKGAFMVGGVYIGTMMLGANSLEGQEKNIILGLAAGAGYALEGMAKKAIEESVSGHVTDKMTNIINKHNYSQSAELGNRRFLSSALARVSGYENTGRDIYRGLIISDAEGYIA